MQDIRHCFIITCQHVAFISNVSNIDDIRCGVYVPNIEYHGVTLENAQQNKG